MHCVDCILHKALACAFPSSDLPLTQSIVVAMTQECAFKSHSQQKGQHMLDSCF